MDILRNWDHVGDRRSIATIALKMLEQQFAYSDILIALQLVNEDKIISEQYDKAMYSTKLGLCTRFSNVNNKNK